MRTKPPQVSAEREPARVIYDRQDEPIFLSKPLSDLLLSQTNPGELMALYWFYYYTAKWQGTDKPFATVPYVMKGLNWGADKVRKNKKDLRRLGLIEDIRRVNAENKVIRWYVKVHFIWSKEKVDQLIHPPEHQEGGEKATLRNIHPVAIQEGNALSTNNGNALSTGRHRAESFSGISRRGGSLPPSNGHRVSAFEQLLSYFPQSWQNDPALAKCIKEWVCFRSEKHWSRYSPRQCKQFAAEQIEYTIDEVVKATYHAIASGHMSVNPKHSNGHKANGFSTGGKRFLHYSKSDYDKYPTRL